jgi:hypothetical protein
VLAALMAVLDKFLSDIERVAAGFARKLRA